MSFHSSLALLSRIFFIRHCFFVFCLFSFLFILSLFSLPLRHSLPSFPRYLLFSICISFLIALFVLPVLFFRLFRSYLILCVALLLFLMLVSRFATSFSPLPSRPPLLSRPFSNTFFRTCSALSCPCCFSFSSFHVCPTLPLPALGWHSLSWLRLAWLDLAWLDWG